MDSLTQMVLGAAVAAAVVPAKMRRRALVYGAALGTLPDLDVLVRYADPVSNMTLHRSYSHSLLLLPFVAIVLWWLARRYDAAVAAAPRRWLAAFLLALVTHPLLDAFTIYGTQLWWPIDPTPIGLGSMFIIDPLYTLPLLIVVILVALRPKPNASPRGEFALPWALGLSSTYLMWSVLAQQFVLERARSDPNRPNSPDSMLLATPAPFTTLLWRVIQRQPGSFDEAYMSLLADSAPVPWVRHPSRDDLRPQLAGHPPYDRLAWFNQGWYSLHAADQRVILSDLRMGSEPLYVFAFALAEQTPNGLLPIPAEQLTRDQPRSAMFGWLGERVFSPGGCLATADQVLTEQTAAPTTNDCSH